MRACEVYAGTASMSVLHSTVPRSTSLARDTAGVQRGRLSPRAGSSVRSTFIATRHVSPMSYWKRRRERPLPDRRSVDSPVVSGSRVSCSESYSCPESYSSEDTYCLRLAHCVRPVSPAFPTVNVHM